MDGGVVVMVDGGIPLHIGLRPYAMLFDPDGVYKRQSMEQ